MTRANTTANARPALALVQVQTMHGKQGTAAAMAEVQNAVKAHNKLNGKAAPHVAVQVRELENNTKGMQYRLALLATVARLNGATMVRLGIHGGAVALCGTKGAIEATHKAHAVALNTCRTLVDNTYDPSKHGSRVGFVNGFTCGLPAGMQVAGKVATVAQYGVGFLYPFQAPGDGNAYALGQTAGMALVKSNRPATSRTGKPAAPATPAATPTVETELETLDRQLAESENVA